MLPEALLVLMSGLFLVASISVCIERHSQASLWISLAACLYLRDH